MKVTVEKTTRVRKQVDVDLPLYVKCDVSPDHGECWWISRYDEHGGRLREIRLMVTESPGHEELSIETEWPSSVSAETLGEKGDRYSSYEPATENEFRELLARFQRAMSELNP